MNNKEIVDPKWWDGWALTPSMLVGIGPKYKIVCGDCEVSFTKRLPLVRSPVVVCPHCGTRNRIPMDFS